MNGKCFGEYDLKKLKDARDQLMVVLNYNYGVNSTRRMWRRLDTIVIKLNELIELNEEMEHRHETV